MQEIKYPFFKKGRILKIEMLENLRDYPRDVLDVYNEYLSDGIICGLMPKVDKDIITFSKGIVKYNGHLYLINAPTSITYGATDVEVIIKLSFYDQLRDNDYETEYVNIEIDKDLEIKDNQIELGRFKLKVGAYLRSDYQDLYDFTTEYNTINIVNVLYSGYGQPTLSNMILKYFAKEALGSRTQNQMDITFSMLCLNSNRVEKEVIYNYIAYRLTEEIKPLESLENKDLHEKLVKVLVNIKRENSGLKRSRVSTQKIILD